MDADNESDIIDMNSYLAPDQKHDKDDNSDKHTKKKSKNKKPYDKPKGDPELNELRKKAQGYCSCYEQWRIVSRYKKEKLVEFIEMKEFDSLKNIRENVFNTIHKGVGILFDKFFRADGYVQNHIENDISLRESIEQEGQQFIKFLSNRSRIAFLLTSDSIQGKMQQYKEKRDTIPPEISIIEDDDQTSSDHSDEKTTTTSDDIMVKDSAIEEGNNEILQMSNGEENMQPTSE